MGGALSLNCSKTSSSWRGALGITGTSEAGDGSELRGCGTWCAFWRLVFAVFRCWFYIKKQIKDDLRSGQKPHEKRQQKSEKIPIKSRFFRIFLLTNNAKCDIIKMSREEGTPLLTEARRRKAVDVLTRSDLILILSMLADLIKAKAKNKIEAVQIILEQIDRLKK